jgi:hypothetical protein
MRSRRGTGEPAVVKDSGGRWHIADAGRGIRYEHLTQNENAEKRAHPQVIGQFGISDRVKAILKACTSSEVAGPLTEDLNAIAAGRQHDEIAWRDVALHACQALQTNERVLFVTAWQMADGTAQIRYAQGGVSPGTARVIECRGLIARRSSRSRRPARAREPVPCRCSSSRIFLCWTRTAS